MSVQSGSDTQTRTPDAILDEGDHEKFSHIVIGGTEAIMRAMLTGVPCEALCGKVWVPSRDPKKFPLCGTCDEIRRQRGWKEPQD